MAWIAPAEGAVGLMNGKKGSNAAQGNANQLTGEQMKLLEQELPFLKEMQGGATQAIPGIISNALAGQTASDQYDPAKDTERALQAFDVAANQSAATSLGNAALPAGLRGLGGSSEQNAEVGNVMARTASQRGALASTMTEGEAGRKAAMRGQAQAGLDSAFSRLNPTSASQSLAGSLGQAAGGQQAQANLFDPQSYIKMFGNFKFPWQTTGSGGGGQGSGYFDMGGLDNGGNWVSQAPGT